MRTFKFEANELQYLFLLILFQIAKSLIWSAYEINIGLLYFRNLCLIYSDFNKSSRIFICSIYHERKHFKFDLKIPEIKENILLLIICFKYEY